MHSPCRKFVLGFFAIAGAVVGVPAGARAQQPKDASAQQPRAIEEQKAKAPTNALKTTPPAQPAPAPPTKVPAPATAVPPAVVPAAASAPVVAPVPATSAPSSMPREPSIYETGRVGKMGVSDSGVKIKQTPDATKPKETRIEGKSLSVSNAPAMAPARADGALNQGVFGRELQPRLALLRGCRVEVARQKRVQAASVPASRVILRWLVLPNGEVAETQVVASAPVDGHVVDCVKRQMSQWLFTPPTGGPARVERSFKFE